MLNSSSSIGATSPKPSDKGLPRNFGYNGATPVVQPALFGDGECVAMTRSQQPVGISSPTVDIAPRQAITRRGIRWQGTGVELVQATADHRVDYHFRSPVHLLAAYEQGMRRAGDSYVEGLPRSALRDVARKLTFAPAGHEYREWHDPRTPMDVTYFYFDPAEISIGCEEKFANILSPRLFFEDTTITSTAAKLRQAIDTPDGTNRLYVESLGVILFHELVRLTCGTPRAEAPVRGGLAAWQRRIVTAYIEEHLSEQIPLATLARLARLSTFHFCRTFKQSFGVPPHRYHTSRRIELAKLLLAERKQSVTEVGLTVGFSETSSFTAVFRKITGQTPSRYHRALG
jgi:AraC family transcriptional regulator